MAADTRTVVQTYMEHLARSEWTEAFALFSDDAVYRITGDTSISGSYQGIDTINAELGKIIGTFFKTMPKFTVYDTLVDGERAAVIASSVAEGKHGTYNQNYVFVFRVKDGRIVEKVENLDSLPVETALLGKRLVNA